MEFELVKGVSERLGDYREIFCNSKLYGTYFADSDQLNDRLRKAMADGDLYVAMSPEDKTVGVMYTTRDGMAGLPYLNLLNVRKRYRGKGVGTDLMKIFISIVEREQCPSMYIMTSQFNTGAKQLYRSLGFQPKCFLHDTFREGMSEWLFMRLNQKLA